jgi:m7GpppX diphosphatase
MKWDLRAVSSLYLVAIAVSPNIRSLRYLRKHHIPMLRNVKREAERVVKEQWGLDKGSLRCFVHYQPSYCKPTRKL